MSHPYDASAKECLETGPADWAAFLGANVDPATVSLIDADLSTVTAAADKVIHIAAEPPWLMNVELQASADRDLPRRLLAYAGLLQSKHACDVASAVILLRPAADHPTMSGTLPLAPPSGPAWEFRYRVVRTWQCDPNTILRAGLGVLPLAPLSDVRENEIPAIIREMKGSIESQASPPLADKLWMMTFVLMGLRFDLDQSQSFLEGVWKMRESSVVQELLRQGRNEGRLEGEIDGRRKEIRRMLLLMGGSKYGSPNPSTTAKLSAEEDLNKLEAYAIKFNAAKSWDELLAE